MNKVPDFEIPETMRNLAEQSVEQAQEAYSRFAEAARSAGDMVSQSSGVMPSGAKDVQDKAMKFAEKNMEANFKLAEEIVQAKDLKQAIEIQSQFARTQMEIFAEQAQKLSNLMTKAVQKAQPKK